MVRVGKAMNRTLVLVRMHETRRLHDLLGYDWLHEPGFQSGSRSGSAFRVTAGFGRRGVMRAHLR